MGKKVKRKMTLLGHCFGSDRTGWASAAAFLKRAQQHDKQIHGIRSWDNYPIHRYGWFTSAGRFLGVGVQAAVPLRKGESVVRVILPFSGSGKDLKALADKAERAKTRQGKLRAVA